METLRIILLIGVVVDAAVLTALLATKGQHNLVLHTILVVILYTLAVIDILGNQPIWGILWIVLTTMNIFSIKYKEKS